MKLLVLGPYGETTSGPSRVLTEVVNCLSQDIQILVVSPKKRRENNRVDFASDNLTVHFQPCGKIPGIPGSHQWVELLRVNRGLARLDFDADCVWIHDAPLFAAYHLSKFRRIPSVSTIHGVFGKFYKSEAQQQLNIVMTNLFSWQNSLFQRYQFRHSTILTTYSKYLEGLITNISPIPSVEIIPNGVSLQKFPISNAPRENVVVYVGRMAKIKGVHILIESMNEVIKDHPEWSLWLVGGAFDQQKSFFEKYMSPEIANRVGFLGQVPNEELSSILSRAGIFVMPTLRDGFEIALMEAMATGIPCVTTDAFERSELYGGYAETVPPNDPKALGSKLNYIIDNYSEINDPKMCEKRINRAREFDWKVITQSYENLFRKLSEFGRPVL